MPKKKSTANQWLYDELHRLAKVLDQVIVDMISQPDKHQQTKRRLTTGYPEKGFLPEVENYNKEGVGFQRNSIAFYILIPPNTPEIEDYKVEKERVKNNFQKIPTWKVKSDEKGNPIIIFP